MSKFSSKLCLQWAVIRDGATVRTKLSSQLSLQWVSLEEDDKSSVLNLVQDDLLETLMGVQLI